MELLSLIATVLSAIAAILAWVAKMRWSKEYADAKDETIKAKEAVIETKNAHIQMLEREIDNLRALTPMKLHEYLQSVKSQLEEYNNHLLNQIDGYKKELEEKNSQMEELSRLGSQKEEKIIRLKKERDHLNKQITYFENQRKEIIPVYHDVATASGSAIKLSDQYPDLMAAFSPKVSEEFKVTVVAPKIWTLARTVGTFEAGSPNDQNATEAQLGIQGDGGGRHSDEQ